MTNPRIGKPIGSKKKELSPDEIETILKLHREGKAVHEIKKQTGKSVPVIDRYIGLADLGRIKC